MVNVMKCKGLLLCYNNCNNSRYDNADNYDMSNNSNNNGKAKGKVQLRYNKKNNLEMD